MHGATVLAVKLGATTYSYDDRSSESGKVPPGTYHGIAHLDHVIIEEAKVGEARGAEHAEMKSLLELLSENLRDHRHAL